MRVIFQARHQTLFPPYWITVTLKVPDAGSFGAAEILQWRTVTVFAADTQQVNCDPAFTDPFGAPTMQVDPAVAPVTVIVKSALHTVAAADAKSRVALPVRKFEICAPPDPAAIVSLP
jgi:hypothetical protein